MTRSADTKAGTAGRLVEPREEKVTSSAVSQSQPCGDGAHSPSSPQASEPSAALSMGRKLHDAWQTANPPSGWSTPVHWGDFDAEQQTFWEKAAVRFAAAIGPTLEPSGEHPVYQARLTLQIHQQQLDQDGVMVGVSREALNLLLKHFSETWNELNCCEDVNLSNGLSGGIEDLCKQRDFWRAATSAPTPPEPSAAWRGIDTAPRDGTRVLLGRFTGMLKANYEGRQAVDFWHVSKTHGFEGWGQFNSHYWPATHWQPLPPPPGVLGKDGGGEGKQGLMSSVADNSGDASSGASAETEGH